MNTRKRLERNKLIIEYRKEHTLAETGDVFDLSPNQVHRIVKKTQEEEEKKEENGES